MDHVYLHTFLIFDGCKILMCSKHLQSIFFDKLELCAVHYLCGEVAVPRVFFYHGISRSDQARPQIDLRRPVVVLGQAGTEITKSEKKKFGSTPFNCSFFFHWKINGAARAFLLGRHDKYRALPCLVAGEHGQP